MNFRFRFLLLFSILILVLAPVAANAASIVALFITDDQDRPVETLSIGQTINLRLRAMTDDNTSDYVPYNSFSSSVSSVAAVGPEGILTATNLGTTVITATYGGMTKSVTLNVVPPFSLSFDQYHYTLNQGDNVGFTLTGQAYFGPDIDYKSKAVYSSSAPDVVQIDVTGMKALKAGSAIIKAQLGSVTAMSTVNVVNKATVTGSDDPQAPTQRSSGYALWNSIRTGMGSSQLVENQLLTRAAQNHANYLHQTGSSQAASSRAHSEIPGETGFTGGSISDRLAYVGYTSSGYGEVIHYIDNSNNMGIQGLIDAPYHRSIMLDPTAKEFGIGISSSDPKITVADIGFTYSSNNPIPYYYPYSGQTNVPSSWYAAESPNPLQAFGKAGTTVGYPITISASGFKKVIFDTASITDSSGHNIDYYKTDSTNSPGNIVILTPKNPLNPNTTYTVAFSGSIEDGSSIQKTWSFTTRPETITSLSVSQSQMSLEVGKSQNLRVWATSDITGNQEVTSQAQYRSSDSKVSVQNGVVTASGVVTNATITISYRGATTSVSISAIDESMDPSNPITPAQQLGSGVSSIVIPTNYKAFSQKMRDLSGYWAEKEIAWAISQNIAQGYEDNTFRPDGNVTEAEFIAFVLRTLKSDTTGIDTKERSHWADELYALAKKYNLPLMGYSDLQSRDTMLTRTRVAEIIAAVDGQSLKGDDAISYLLKKGYSNGKTEATIEGYKGNDLLTRAETIKFLMNLLQKGVKEVK